MTEPEVEDGSFSRYTPQHPLPAEIRKMTRDDTVCQYCGVSYLIHTEIKKLEDKLKATEKELEFYKGREDRETKLKAEKDELLTNKKELEETLASKENVLAMLKQELQLASEASKTLQDKLQDATASAEKYRQQYLTVLRKFSSLSSTVRQQRECLQELRQQTQTWRENTAKDMMTARDTIIQMSGSAQKEFETLQSRLQCVEMEHTVVSQSNKTLTGKLKAQEERSRNLEMVEKEMTSLETKNKDLTAKLKETQGQLNEAVAKSRHLQMEAEQFHQQIRSKNEELDQLMRDKHQQAQNSDVALKGLDRQLRQKEGELTTVQKQLKNLENKHREFERRQADINQQNILSANEAKTLRENLDRAKGDVEALKNEREMMITAHQSRIEELRESFKKKMAETERWPEKLQAALAEEKAKHQSELSALETRLKESFVMELKIEKEKYDELLQKYQSQSKQQNTQKAAEIADVESRHRRELDALKQQVVEAKKQAESREAELKKEIDSLKRIISDLQDKLAKFESRGEEQAGELSRQVETLRLQLKTSEDRVTSLDNSLQQTKEEVQFLQDTVRNECEERFELTEALSEARRELLALKRPNGGYPSSTTSRTSQSPMAENGLAPLRKSSSVHSIQSAASSAPSDPEGQRSRAGAPTSQVNVSYHGDNPKTAKPKHPGTVADNRRRISALLGRP